MTSPAKFRKDKEIIAEYETQVKGKCNVSLYDAFSLGYLCVTRWLGYSVFLYETAGANPVVLLQKTLCI